MIATHRYRTPSLPADDTSAANNANNTIIITTPGAVPVIASAWLGVAEAECRGAAAAGEDAYCAAFNPKVPLELEDMRAEHER